MRLFADKEIYSGNFSRKNTIYISGSGKPSIVLINGGSGLIEGWMKVIPEILIRRHH